MKEQDEKKEEGKKRKRSTSETEDTREKKSMKIEEELTEMDKILQSYGLPISFDSTKEKHVEGSDCYGVKMAISLRKIDQSDHEFSCFYGKDKGKGKGKVI
jgi:hypothetical protein